MRIHVAALGGAGLVSALLLALAPASARAHSGGVNSGECSGCHNDGDQTLSLSTAPSSINPGSTVTVRLTVNANFGSETGVFIHADTGSLGTVAGEGLATVGGALTHSSPLALSGGQRTIEFEFTAPQSPGSVRFSIWNVVANGNNSSSGDGATDAVFDFVYGCTGQSYFRDHDGDGYGRNSEERLVCMGSNPGGYAPEGDDCDDNRDTVYPGATEYCNNRDDDCDDEIDEDALPVEQYPDADGDGYYGASEALSDDIFLGCVPTEGYAAEPGDCNPDDPTIHPDAEEVCNLLDDNCDNRVDEGVRPTCGEGWCRRAATTCDESTCYPGPPSEETCNFIDDDCNGIVDDGELCDGDLQCIAGECQDPAAAAGTGTGGDGGGGTAGSGAATDGGTDSAGQTGPTVVPARTCAVTASEPPPWAALWVLLLAFTRGRPRNRRRGRRDLRDRPRPGSSRR
jgi:hypothetical protein